MYYTFSIIFRKMKRDDRTSYTSSSSSSSSSSSLVGGRGKIQFCCVMVGHIPQPHLEVNELRFSELEIRTPPVFCTPDELSCTPPRPLRSILRLICWAIVTKAFYRWKRYTYKMINHLLRIYICIHMFMKSFA